MVKKIQFFRLFKRAFEDFSKNDPLRIAGATAFFASFALPAVLIILIQVFGLLLSQRFMSRKLFQNLRDLLGQDTAHELHQTLLKVHQLFGNGWQAALGFLFLIFVATTLLKVVKDSLNQLWNIRTISHPGIKFKLLTRLKSLSVILVGGLLFLLVLSAESGIDFLQEQTNYQPEAGSLIFKAGIRQILTFLLAAIWFSLLFKFLPDAKPSWKSVLVGGLFTGFFFMPGKLLLQWLLTYSNMHNIYGASASSVLILLFVFYSSFIFYYGACFTRAWTEYNKKIIRPGEFAEKFAPA